MLLNQPFEKGFQFSNSRSSRHKGDHVGRILSLRRFCLVLWLRWGLRASVEV